MKWLEALKAWNAKMTKKNKSHKWKMPKKGTPEHAQVKKMMGKDAKPAKPAKPSKSKDIQKNDKTDTEMVVSTIYEE